VCPGGNVVKHDNVTRSTSVKLGLHKVNWVCVIVLGYPDSENCSIVRLQFRVKIGWGKTLFQGIKQHALKNKLGGKKKGETKWINKTKRLLVHVK